MFFSRLTFECTEPEQYTDLFLSRKRLCMSLKFRPMLDERGIRVTRQSRDMPLNPLIAEAARTPRHGLITSVTLSAQRSPFQGNETSVRYGDHGTVKNYHSNVICVLYYAKARQHFRSSCVYKIVVSCHDQIRPCCQGF